MGYDVNVLKTTSDCRLVLARSKQKNDQFYKAVFMHMGELEESNYSDPLLGAFNASLLVSEQIRTELNGRTTKSTRVRNAVKAGGSGMDVVKRLFEKWANEPEKSGFWNLLDVGLLRFTAEYIVAYRFPKRFSADAVEKAKAKLAKHGVTL